MFKEKQPLRVETGWKVAWNTFNEVDPSEETMLEFWGSSLLSLHHEHGNRLIDLAWRPEGDIEGRFILLVLNTQEIFNPKTNTQELDTDWEHPYLKFESKSRIEIVDKLEQLMLQLPPFIDPRILKTRGVIDEPSETYRIELVEKGLSDKLIFDIISNGNRQIQNLLIDHPQINKTTLKNLSENGCNSKVKKKALEKLKSKKFR
jgi:hypothetical protein